MRITIVGYVDIEDSYTMERKLVDENKGEFYLGIHWISDLHYIKVREILERKMLLKKLENEEKLEYHVVFMTTNSSILSIVGRYINSDKINQEDVGVYYCSNKKIVYGEFEKPGYLTGGLPIGFFENGM